MFVRAGAIIPQGPALNYVGEKPVDPITFHIYPDDAGKASTTLYEDDGLTPAYKMGAFRRTAVTFDRSQVRDDVVEGTYNPGPRKFAVVIHVERRR